jgi:hypothetical protein
MITTDAYNLAVVPNTRNHKGDFVRLTRYRFVEVTPAGWAMICQDRATCHMVDPDALREIVDVPDQLRSERKHKF